MKLNKEEEVPSEEESDSALSTKKTTKRVEAKNKEKQKPNMPRSRVKRKINASSDTDNDNKSSIKSDSVPVKGSDLEEPALPPLKQPKQIKTDLSSDEDEESNSVKERSTEEGQSHHKTDTVEDGVYLKDEQNIDDIDVESDNTIKDDGGAGLKMIPGPDVEDRNSESIGEVEQKLNAESTSPKRTINSADDNSCEDDKPQKKKRKAGKNSAKSVNDKSANDNSINNKSVNNKTTNEKDDKRIKNLKSFITKCGVRKNWTKELADCNTDSSKIHKLKQILMDLGVEGRPTLEKCKKVKMKLELEAELGAMDVDNIISDDVKETRKARASRGIFNPVRRRVSRVTQSSPTYIRILNEIYI
ncbi:hypothetical protein C1645_506359 [Glomus cerebriforme]|uniref:Uncharacterized protein n=1 Tax=Glomus cerebriforme TaxID=658196 RepID=A0A397TCN3_9GLOM|nr:hypothetical protein C1645_506359 [Glomus cerebriforme]